MATLKGRVTSLEKMIEKLEKKIEKLEKKIEKLSETVAGLHDIKKFIARVRKAVKPRKLSNAETLKANTEQWAKIEALKWLHERDISPGAYFSGSKCYKKTRDFIKTIQFQNKKSKSSQVGKVNKTGKQ